MDREQKRAALVGLMSDLLSNLLMHEFMSLAKLRKALRDAGLGNPTENQIWDAFSDAGVTLTPAYRASDVRAIEERYRNFDEAYRMNQGGIDLAHWGKLMGFVRVRSRLDTPFVGV